MKALTSETCDKRLPLLSKAMKSHRRSITKANSLRRTAFFKRQRVKSKSSVKSHASAKTPRRRSSASGLSWFAASKNILVTAAPSTCSYRSGVRCLIAAIYTHSSSTRRTVRKATIFTSMATRALSSSTTTKRTPNGGRRQRCSPPT